MNMALTIALECFWEDLVRVLRCFKHTVVMQINAAFSCIVFVCTDTAQCKDEFKPESTESFPVIRLYFYISLTSQDALYYMMGSRSPQGRMVGKERRHCVKGQRICSGACVVYDDIHHMAACH